METRSKQQEQQMVIEDVNEDLIFVNTILLDVQKVRSITRLNGVTTVMYEDGDVEEFELSDKGHNDFVKAVQTRYNALIAAGVIDDLLKKEKEKNTVDERVVRAIKLEIPK